MSTLVKCPACHDGQLCAVVFDPQTKGYLTTDVDELGQALDIPASAKCIGIGCLHCKHRLKVS